ncbi:MAG: hypothetical protein IIA87_02635 [Nanoarchaeota archaeon]|nr:hypothetical protein [Nanoarchaeota archaeon]
MQKTKRGIYIIMWAVFLILLISSSVDAGFFSDIWNKVTGQATSGADINITVGAGGTAPQITFVYNLTPELLSGITLTEGPAYTAFYINFSANDTEGATNLDASTARLNISRAGEAIVHNSTCTLLVSDGVNANFSCLINTSWFSQAGVWTINASITDLGSNTVYSKNSTYSGALLGTGTAEITINSLTAFVSGPGNITFATIAGGDVNTTSNNDPLRLNNTGNQDFGDGSMEINATDLIGEVTSSEALYSGNFSVGNVTGSNEECNFQNVSTTRMNFTHAGGNFVTLKTGNMSRGNFSLNDGQTGQETLFFCLLLAGTELSQQSYSTAVQGAWTIRVT